MENGQARPKHINIITSKMLILESPGRDLNALHTMQAEITSNCTTSLYRKQLLIAPALHILRMQR